MNDEWHVVFCRFGYAFRAVEALGALSCVSEVYAPVRTSVGIVRGRSVARSYPWLGLLLLARWPGDDPHAWHDVINATDPVRPLTSVISSILGGWPPASVSDASVQRFADVVRAFESKGDEVNSAPPCTPGDIVRFNHLEIFQNVHGHCLWVSAGFVGARVRMLGHDLVIQVPYGGIETVVRVMNGRQRRYGRR